MDAKISAERLKYAMNLMGVKASELSRVTGVKTSSISQYLSGKYVPNQVNAYKMANFLCVNPAWLIGLDVPMVENTSDSTNKTYQDLLDLIKDYNNEELKQVLDHAQYVKYKRK